MAGTEVATAYVHIIPSFEGAEGTMTDAIVPGLEAAGNQGGGSLVDALLGQVGGAASNLLAMGGELGGALTEGISTFLSGAGSVAIAGAFVAIGVAATDALMDIGTEFDDMTDTIIVGTGASGDALRGLQDDAEAIATTVPTSFATAGDIVQDFNTRLGLSGETLQDVGGRAAALGQILGEDINYDQVATMFSAWGTGAEDMASEMDYLFGVSQATGIGFDELTGIVQTAAPAMSELGFSMDETADIAGALDRAGLDASGMLGKMGKALVELAEPGEDARETYDRLVSEMQGYIDAGDTASALDIAESLFGTKGATQFLAAVESGAMSMDELGDAALGASGDIMGTMEATSDWPEQWELLKNSIKVALEPLASGVFSAAGEGMRILSDAIQAAVPFFEQVGAAFMDTLGPALATADEKFTELGEVAGPLVEQAMAALEPVISTVADLLGGSLASTMTVVVTIAGGVADVLSFLVTNVFPPVASAVQTVADAFSGAFSTISTTVSNLASTVSSTFESIKSAISDKINAAKDTISNVIDTIKGLFNFSISWPNVPVPHFSISPAGWKVGDLLKGSIPSLSIYWAAKGGIVDSPTITGIIAGEAGPEAIVPLTAPNLAPFAEAISGAIDAGGMSLVVNGLSINADEDIERMFYQLMLAIDRKRSM